MWNTSRWRSAALSALFVLGLGTSAEAAEPVKVKVFVGAMFEIGKNTGDRAGEFQNWYERYWQSAEPIAVKGALNPVYCNADGVCGAVLGMGKVSSSASMQAILLNPQLDLSQAYFIISGVAGTPPSRGTIAEVNWATWLVDYDLGHRWAPEEGKPGEPTFMPRKGYESVRLFQMNPTLVSWAMKLTGETPLKDSDSARAYRQRYPQDAARRAPFVGTGTHMTGDTFFHGPGMSEQAQYIAKLYGADDYVITEMEAAAITLVIKRTLGSDRVMSLRGAVNFDQGNPKETTLEHLDPKPGETAGGFAETVENVALVGARMTDHIVSHWDQWQAGVPALPAQ
ncbi:purine nucleoside permease (plasmid) [Azospirillum baldaniorum]|uniref:Purine nucleoside permease n=1 Tax=Azospirillum baldaniorum TaxID=1064539 RepID=A0A9P1JUA4_9PROT|nr:purine nucleoside permease [Azospirillum baldaniorum]TWA83541.1 purine nucleoside permease [Azospirillum brasilense]CCC99922.1 Purine nucleoside permease [Azospirillum baldaniorum]